MARIVLGSYMVQFPLGGYMSWVLQWLVGLRDLGHEVFFVEKSGSPQACYDPIRNVMTDDASYGFGVVRSLLERFQLHHSFTFVDFNGQYLGLSREEIEKIFRSTDLFVDMGTHGAWADAASHAGLRVLIDGEPAATQIKMEKALRSGRQLPDYDRYYTVGTNIPAGTSTAPAAGRKWHHVFYPVSARLFPPSLLPADAVFTTVMSWQAHDAVEFNGVTYGAKDREFTKFMSLPKTMGSIFEIAVAGRSVPHRELADAGWRVRDSHAVTLSFDDFQAYIRTSKGEFSVCKNVFVATNSGWFGDRAAAYLGSARPVVMQETGFSAHLPCGRGLFAVRTAEDAEAAIEQINANPDSHCRWAREVAMDCLEAGVVLRRFLGELGVS